MPDVWFPFLGIEFDHINRVAFTIFGIDIAWYGILIATGAFLALLLVRHLARHSGQDPDMYVDFTLYALLFGIAGARLYYVIFSLDSYKDNLLEVFNLRNGGLAIYGGVIAAVIVCVIFMKKRKQPFLKAMDTLVPGLALGQAIGRWGNFFNQEAFGSYTDGLFAMRLNVETAAYTTPQLLAHAVTEGGKTYIQVHPTFLYESFFCLCLVIIMVIFYKRKKFDGQIMCIYMMGYGCARAFIESLRTDQLLLPVLNFPVSIVVSCTLAISGLVLFILLSRNAKVKALANKDYKAISVDETETEMSEAESTEADNDTTVEVDDEVTVSEETSSEL